MFMHSCFFPGVQGQSPWSLWRFLRTLFDWELKSVGGGERSPHNWGFEALPHKPGLEWKLQSKFIYCFGVAISSLFISNSGLKAQNFKSKKNLPIPVKTLTVTPKIIPQILSYVAALEGGAQADVYSKVVGRIAALPIKEGEPVRAKQVLFRIDRNDPGETFLTTPIVSPISGWVAKWFVSQVGEQVTTQLPVMTVVDDRTLKAQVYLPTKEWLMIKQHTSVKVRIDTEEKPAKIVSIARAADASSGRGSIDVEIENGDRKWQAGMIARIIFEVEPTQRIVIPSTGLTITENGAHVFVVTGQTVKRQKVSFNLWQTDLVEITHGLKADDIIVIEGANMLSDKSVIQVDAGS